MEQENTTRKFKTFPNLKAESFQHPWDRQAISALQAIPGFEFLVKKLMEIGFEQFFRITNLASNIHVKGKMLPRLRESLRYATRILDMAEPELYITTHPLPNAFTYGETRPFIVLTSGLIEAMDEEEMFFVLAHELGHIKCGHVLYKTMARNFKMVLDIAAGATFGMSALISTGLEMAMFDWERKSELSADRAGMICVQNQHIANRAFMKMAAASPKLYAEMDEGEFLRQIRSYEDAADESFINKTYTALLTSRMTHPFLIMRAKQLDSWIQGGGFSDLTGIDPMDARAENGEFIETTGQ
ncbi:MAG: M48 family peptidase [Erysipelotrichia bacterium]|nr:M48 family metallopeptidase [Candidatus Riflebacteria bacterium]NCB38243.1 M48 family peptidase [Erysipelotrichia bacterium]